MKKKTRIRRLGEKDFKRRTLRAGLEEKDLEKRTRIGRLGEEDIVRRT